MFLDTSGLFCYLDTASNCHQDAVVYYLSAPSLLIHSYVLAEFVPLCQARGLPRNDALAFITDLMDNEGIEIVWVDEDLHRQSLSLLQARPDKQWSLCDAVSFVLMDRRGLRDALTTDHHYAQAGLHPLLT